MKAFFALLLCFIASNALAALVVDVAIVDRGILVRRDARLKACVVEATVQNRSDKECVVTLMSCGWHDSFEVEPIQSVQIAGWICTSNIPTEVEMKPGESIVFRFTVVVESGFEGSPFKVGFTQSPRILTGEGKPAIHWSESLAVPAIPEVVIQEQHEMKRQPNQALQTTPMTRSVYGKTIEFGHPQRGV